MIDSVLKRTLLISLLGHLALFGIFSFSFGNNLSRLNYSGIYFWGMIFRQSDVVPFVKDAGPYDSARLTVRQPAVWKFGNTGREPLSLNRNYLKPAVNLAYQEDKRTFVSAETPISFAQQRKESVVMFYPQLPYNFTLYFKDRQMVHIELMFNVMPAERTSSIALKRKISSGNLEADLLSMRYISRYLLLQQKAFAPNQWQTAKIDLSAKVDE